MSDKYTEFGKGLQDRKVSFQKNVKGNSIDKILTFREVIDNFKNGQVKEQVEKLRKIREENEGKYKAKKADYLPAILFAGVFDPIRNNESCVEGSGIAIADIDDIEHENMSKVKSIICEIPFVTACTCSPSGAGYKVLYHIPVTEKPSEYRQYSTAFSIFLEENVGNIAKVDHGANKDISRACFETYDPEIYVNYNPKLWIKRAPDNTSIPINKVMDGISQEKPSPRQLEDLLGKDLHNTDLMSAVRSLIRQGLPSDDIKNYIIDNVDEIMPNSGDRYHHQKLRIDLDKIVEKINNSQTERKQQPRWDLDELTEKFQHDLFSKYEEPPVVFKINDRITGTDGNLSLVIGPKKSKKTFFILIQAVSALIKKKFCNAEVMIDEGKCVYVFDTEQGRWHVQKFSERIRKAIVKEGLNLSEEELRSKLKIYSLRSADSVQQRSWFIQEVIKANANEIGIVFIDGIRDLLLDINESGQAIQITTEFMALSAIYSLHIQMVLHTNKLNDNARGHIGSELENKAESVIHIQNLKQNPKYSIVECSATRNISFDPFTFGIDEADELPYPGDGNLKAINGTSNKKPAPGERDNEEYLKLTETWEDITTKQAYEKIYQYFEIGVHKQRDCLKYMVDNNLVRVTTNPNFKAKLYSAIEHHNRHE